MSDIEKTTAESFRRLEQEYESESDPEKRPVILKFEKAYLAFFRELDKADDMSHYYFGLMEQSFKKLLRGQGLGPVRDEPELWTDVREYGDDPMRQHKVDSRFFKHADGQISFSDAIIWQEGKGDGDYQSRFHGRVEIEGPFITLPIHPKTFYIDVVSWESKRDWWSHRIKDPKQLKAVEEYYGIKIKVPFRPFRKIENWLLNQFQKHVRKRCYW